MKKTDFLREFANTVANGDIDSINNAFVDLQNNPLFQSKGWRQMHQKLASVFNGEVSYTIFAEGNGKLPFYAFSTIPGFTCPGAGECLKFCYSFRAWRYPNAFARQIQNAFFMRFYPHHIREAFAKLPNNVDFRLYVDGDFSSADDVEFWFSLLNDRADIRAYGYSKSFAELLAYTGPFPKNYMLNISSGHRHDDDIVSRVKGLPITRGEFRAVSIGIKVKSNMHGTKIVNDALRIKSNEKIFPCPGKCGSCTGAGHACGLPQMKGRTIAIAIH